MNRTESIIVGGILVGLACGAFLIMNGERTHQIATRREFAGNGGITYDEGASEFGAQYELAQQAMSTRSFDEAERIYSELTIAEPGSANPLVGLGSVLCCRLRYAEGIAKYQEALAKDGGSTMAMLGIASASISTGNWLQCKIYSDMAIAADDTNADAHYCQAVSLENLGDIPGALQHYRKAVALAPRAFFAESVGQRISELAGSASTAPAAR